MSLLSKLRKWFMSEVENQNITAPDTGSVVDQVAAEVKPAEEVAAVAGTTETGTAEVKTDVVAEAVPAINTDAIAAGLNAIGHPVGEVWEDVVSFAKAAESDFHTAAKAALGLIEHSAVSVYDKVVALLKHKS